MGGRDTVDVGLWRYGDRDYGLGTRGLIVQYNVLYSVLCIPYGVRQRGLSIYFTHDLIQARAFSVSKRRRGIMHSCIGGICRLITYQ